MELYDIPQKMKMKVISGIDVTGGDDVGKLLIQH
jgi:hypothetical protein